MIDTANRGRAEIALLWFTIGGLVALVVAIPFAVGHHFALEAAWIPLAGGVVASGAALWEAFAERRLRAWHVASFLGGAIAIGGSYLQGAEADAWVKGKHCVWSFMGDPNDGPMQTTFDSPTEYPAYDCDVEIRELHGGPGRWSGPNPVFFAEHLGNLPPHGGKWGPTIELGSRDYRRFVVQIATRSGYYHQAVYFRRVNGRWQTASRVVASHSSRVIYERIDPEFPRDDRGEPDWH